MTGYIFDDSDAYEQFMGRWSRALGQRFVRWMGPPTAARWLDVGCGTGIFSQLVLDTCSPAAVSAVDPAKAQIEGACRVARRGVVEFRLADAQALPFADASFDVVASTLVINFIPDRPRALSEMCRVARPGGLVAGCVWDFAAELSPSWPLRRAMRRIGVDVPPVPGGHDSSLDALARLFSAAGLQRIAMTSVEVVVPFLDFDELWRSLTARCAPATKLIDAMPRSDRRKLLDALRAELPGLAGGSISYSARANAIRGHVRASPV
jgi:ubiquinone/menaquinone biosynthesis C-methylase UbiE